MKSLFDYMNYLDCPKDIRYERVLQRVAFIGDINERRYWIGEDYYLSEEDPLKNAGIVIKCL